MGKLDGKVAIITGTSAGIGKATAIRFAEEGAKVAMCARREGKLLETAKLCDSKNKSSKCLAMVADVTKPDDCKKLVDKTVLTYGTIDILVNNAEGSPPEGAPHQLPFIDTPLEYFDALYKGSLLSTVIMMKLCYPYMKGKESSIINYSSGAHFASMKGNSIGLHAYAAAKAAVAGITRTVADEWGADGIRINVLYPMVVTDTLEENLSGLKHLVDQEMKKNALQRIGYAYEDCAGVCVFLASPDSRFITGQSIHVEGGAWMGMA